MLLRQKKAVSEQVSFVLLTLVVAVASLSAYFFAKDFIDRHTAELDEEKMQATLKKVAYKINEISSFDGASGNADISFSKGLIGVNGNQIYYSSLVPYQGTLYCYETLCLENNKNTSRYSFNLPSGYTFDKNFTLVPGTYKLLLEHDKTISQIKIRIK